MHLNATRPMGHHVRAWLVDEYPALVSQGFGPHEFVQRPGELVFVPEGWWHATINLADTLAVSRQLGANPRLAEGLLGARGTAKGGGGGGGGNTNPSRPRRGRGSASGGRKPRAEL